ncbi:hypothetical protein B0H11DRAFT_2291051 [Mycena galericulata]|nr:hypothetical protein B0H11DRAFT_2291051 [Mycena galericulata]
MGRGWFCLSLLRPITLRSHHLRSSIPRNFRWFSSSIRPLEFLHGPNQPNSLAADYSYESELAEIYCETIKKCHITKELLPGGWSSDWKHSSLMCEFSEFNGYRPSHAERDLNIMHKIRGPITLLAFSDDFTSERRVLFFADGKYYVYYTWKKELYRWDAPAETFTSHDDFLRRYWELDKKQPGLPEAPLKHLTRAQELDQVDVYGGHVLDPTLLDPSLRVVNPPRRYMGRASARDLSENWHSQETLPSNWSCDWQNWPAIRQFFVQSAWYSLSPVDILFRVRYDIAGPLVPLAYFTEKHTQDEFSRIRFSYIRPQDEFIFVFAAGGEYYYIEKPSASGYTHLLRYEGQFASHGDFLARVEAAPRVTVPEKEGYNQRRYKIDEEQRALRTADWLRRFEHAH